MERIETDQLFEAASNGSVNSLHKLLSDDPLILDRIAVNCFSETPLHVATMLGHVDFVKEIIRIKPELTNELNSHQSSPLHLAAAKGHADVVKALLSVDPRTCLARDRNVLTPLHVAALRGRLEVVKILLQAKPEAARLTVYGGETILHLCVKHYQIESLKLLMKTVAKHPHFINSKDSHGNTILHLAVADKQVESIHFLLAVAGLEVNALNISGMTPLDILFRSRMDVRDQEIQESLEENGGISKFWTNSSQNIETRFLPCSFNQPNSSTINQNNNNSSKKLHKKQDDWLERKKSALMIVASLIATMAFQVGVNPPNGVWQDSNANSVNSRGYPDPHSAGFSILATNYPEAYTSFYAINTTSFIASLSIILLLMSGLPLRRRFFMWILMVITWIAITATAITYTIAITVLTPVGQRMSVSNVIVYSVLVWLFLVALLLIGHTIRFVVKLVRKTRKLVRKTRRTLRRKNRVALDLQLF